jgi:hypothetical protein
MSSIAPQTIGPVSTTLRSGRPWPDVQCKRIVHHELQKLPKLWQVMLASLNVDSEPYLLSHSQGKVKSSLHVDGSLQIFPWTISSSIKSRNYQCDIIVIQPAQANDWQHSFLTPEVHAV